jgi:hypothetical protein
MKVSSASMWNCRQTPSTYLSSEQGGGRGVCGKYSSGFSERGNYCSVRSGLGTAGAGSRPLIAKHCLFDGPGRSRDLTTRIARMRITSTNGGTPLWPTAINLPLAPDWFLNRHGGLHTIRQTVKTGGRFWRAVHQRPLSPVGRARQAAGARCCKFQLPGGPVTLTTLMFDEPLPSGAEHSAVTVFFGPCTTGGVFVYMQ